jgi:hypothetical protein
MRPVEIRLATAADLPVMLQLSAVKREQYEAYQPIFHRRAQDAVAAQEPYLRGLIERDDVVALIAANGVAVVGFGIAGVNRLVLWLLATHPWRDGDADQQSLRAEEARHHLTPGFGPVLHEQAKAALLKLARRSLNVVDVELEPGLGDRDVGRPLIRPEAGFGRLGERPDSEGLRPVHLFGV